MRATTRRQQRSTVHLDQRSILSLEFLRRWYREILNEEPSSSQIIRRALDVLCDQLDRGPSVSWPARLAPRMAEPFLGDLRRLARASNPLASPRGRDRQGGASDSR
jgi:hypothetical protein